MTADPLYQPLGTAKPAPARNGGRRLIWTVSAVFVAVAAGTAAWTSTHHGRSEPAVVVATIETPPPAPPPAVVPAPAPPPAPTPAAAGSSSDGGNTTVEVQNGVKIIRFNATAPAAGGMTAIPVPSPGAAALKPAPDPRVTERTPQGPLPRIGRGDLRAAEVYARPTSAVTTPRLALLLDGMGADQLAAADAARRLPPDLSFAFPPDAPDAAAQVADARRAGHEVFLDLPSGGSLQADAGQGADVAPADALALLHRQLAGFAGYPGVVLNASAVQPAALADIPARGLLVVSRGGGASDRGTVPPPDPSGGLVPDLMIDAASGPTALAAAIDKLGRLARANGSAFGVIRDAPLAANTLAALFGGLDKAGVTLVPVTALTATRVSDRRAVK